MKLPKQIVSKHRIRDFAICKEYVENGKTQQEIANIFGMAQTSISAILYRNSALLKPNKELERVKRMNSLKRLHLKAMGTLNKNRDEIDVLEQMRKELELEKGIVIDQSTHQHVTYVWNNEDDKNQLRTTALPALDSQQ